MAKKKTEEIVEQVVETPVETEKPKKKTTKKKAEEVATVEVTEENPLSERKLTLLSLKNQPFVSTGRTNPIYKTFISACERQGFTPNFVLECNDYICIDRALRANVGLGVTLSTDASMGSAGMRHLNIVDFNERLNFCIYYKKTYGEIEKIVEYLKTGAV